MKCCALDCTERAEFISDLEISVRDQALEMEVPLCEAHTARLGHLRNVRHLSGTLRATERDWAGGPYAPIAQEASA